MARPRELPDRARVVIIGGGVGGASIAYHLAGLGESDVLLVDRDELTSGSTFHSAGLVGQLRSSVSLTTMMMYSVQLYRSLDCGWIECGGIRLACTPGGCRRTRPTRRDRKSTRLNSSHPSISYAVFCLKKKKKRTSHHAAAC